VIALGHLFRAGEVRQGHRVQNADELSAAVIDRRNLMNKTRATNRIELGYCVLSLSVDARVRPASSPGQEAQGYAGAAPE
jgi:hypothetical protein